MTALPALPAAAEPRAYAHRALVPLFHAAEDELGPAQARGVFVAAGVDPAGLGAAGWVDAPVFHAVLAGLAGASGSAEAFRRLCMRHVVAGMGPLAPVLPFLGPPAVLALFGRLIGHGVRGATFSVVSVADDGVVVRSTFGGDAHPLLLVHSQAVLTALGEGLGWPLVGVEFTLRHDGVQHVVDYTIALRPAGPQWGRWGLLGGAAAGAALSALGLGWESVVWGPLLGWALARVAGARARPPRVTDALADRAFELIRRFEEGLAAPVAPAPDAAHAGAAVDALAQSLRVRALSHDLRNPLLVLRMVQDPLFDSADDEERAALRRAAADALCRAEALLEDFLHVSTDPALGLAVRARPLTPATWAHALQARLAALLTGSKVQGVVVCGADAPAEVLADPLVLDRIADNLLTNAVKYTAAGEIRVELAGDAAGWSLTVSDTGRGMDAGALARAWRARGTEARLIRGVGLGLSVVVHLVALSGGRIEAASQPGRGTRVRVVFPVAAPAEAPVVPADEEARVGATVRIVDFSSGA